MRCLFFFGALLFAAAAWGAGPHHQLDVHLQPADHRLTVKDSISLGQAKSPVDFLLHQGLSPRVTTPGARLESVANIGRSVPLTRYRLYLPAGAEAFTLEYGGVIHHPLRALGGSSVRGEDTTPGIIAADGVFLAGSSGWYPVLVEHQFVTFALTVSLPAGWDAVSQGRRGGEGAVSWEERKPQESIYLVAGPFNRYSRQAADVTVEAYLRHPDAALAERYLAAAGPYLDLYQGLIGDYPYAKFALVENVWQSGWGMPSFTLMGSRILRLPFIIHTSYPHEILHNWWGNSVYADRRSGNWSEGLTAYLSDHLLRAQRGEGREYRRTALQQYNDYVAAGEDFPLAQFRSRHSEATQAVGYGKTMMLFHMLRRHVGDEAFRTGLQRFYRRHQFTEAGFGHIQAAFEAVAGHSLAEFFDQWVERTGAPQLALGGAVSERAGDGFKAHVQLAQTQRGPAYALEVPLAFTLEGRPTAVMRTVAMGAKTQRLTVQLPARPVRVAVDPGFDLFRRLDPSEVPAALSQLFAASERWFVLPAAAGAARREAYRQLAAAWQEPGVSHHVVSDADLAHLPATGAVWLLGWENRWRPSLEEALGGHPVDLDAVQAKVAGQTMARGQAHVVVSGRGPGGNTVAWLAAEPQAVPGLARKLPHYGKYSYLAFAGQAPDNILKGTWGVNDSALMGAVRQPDGSLVDAPMAPLPGDPPLATLAR